MPGAANKFHYFQAGEITSLCGRWLYAGEREGETATTITISKQDCVTCHRKLMATKPAPGTPS